MRLVYPKKANMPRTGSKSGNEILSIGECFFVLSALVTGAATQLQWFIKIWDPRSQSLYDFAWKGGWQGNFMTWRLIGFSLAMTAIFYLFRTSLRLTIRLSPVLSKISEDYRRYDRWLYGIFFLSCSDIVGVHIDRAVLLEIFLTAQMALIAHLKPDPNRARDLILSRNKPLLWLFLISGFAALIYQIVWQRALFQAFGVNIESVTIIVSIFMLGLGMGSLAGGYLSKRFPDHLPHLFLVSEAIIGLFGLFSLKLIAITTQSMLYSSLFKVSLTVYGLLLIPTLFMGATLPILVTYFYSSYRNIGKSLSVLYFVNTIGSALACFATVCILFRYAGLGVRP